MPAYPLLEFVLSVGTFDLSGEAYPDTGFEGGIAIPVGVGREIIAAPFETLVRLADGSTVSVPLWDGNLELNGRRFRAEVVALGRGFLIGRDVLDQIAISFEFGKTVHLRFRDETGRGTG